MAGAGAQHSDSCFRIPEAQYLRLVIDDTLLRVAIASVLVPWALLVVAPRWRWTDLLAQSPLPALVLVPIYVTCIFFDSSGPAAPSFFTVDGIQSIFAARRTAVGCWVHYLVFDLFVGAWQVRDARRHAIRHALVVPCLLLTLWFGPVGFAAYLVLRFCVRGRVSFMDRQAQRDL